MSVGAAAAAASAGVDLTGEQEEAVERRLGPLLLAANAGSGKTAVLVERFVRAVHDDGVAASRILAITFTERAAAEVRQRVRRRLDELGDRGAARDTEAAFVSTIHGFCARLLRAHPLAAGVAPGFAVLDEGTAYGLRQQAFERALAAWMSDERAVDLAAACGVDRLAAAVDGVHDELRSRGRTRPELPGARPRHDPAEARAALAGAGAVLARELDGGRVGRRVREALARLERDPLGSPLGELKLHRGARALQTPAADGYEAARMRCLEAEADAAGVVGLDLLGRLLDGFAGVYAGLKEARGALDFDDLELCARDLLAEDPELRGRWSERFELLMVDEFQDTNPREMAILASLDRGNLFTVGDEFQSIYGFRHADVGVFRGRRRELAGSDCVRALSRNFRSRPAILAAINATFAPIFGPSFVPLVAGRADPADLSGPLVELMLNDARGWEEPTTPGAGPTWRRAEAALLACRIEELIGDGTARPGEVVVLLRYATAAGIYARALADRGVAVSSAPGGGFYLAPEVSDLADYARVLANPLDEMALYGVLSSPLGGVGADGLAVLGLAARSLGRPPWEVLDAGLGGEPAAAAALAPLEAGERARLESAHGLIVRERAEAPRRGMAELLLRSGYRERAGCRPLGLANLRKLLRLAREFEAREGRDLRRFADRLAEGRLGAAREQDAQLAETDAVRLMTVHAAKGLEFPVVCYADLGHGPPIGLPLILTDGERVGLRLSTLASTRSEAFAYAELRGDRDRAALAEEQRIAYVAMTRARERLILSGAADFARWPAPGPAAPTVAWLAPALVADLPARLGGPPGVSEVVLGGVPVRLTLSPSGAMPPPAAVPAPAPAAPKARTAPAQLALFGESWPTAAPAPAPQLRGPPAPNSGRPDSPLAAPELAGAGTPPPSSVSYSSLADHARCGYGYYLRRVLGLAEVSPPPGLADGRREDAAARGRLVHGLLERLDFARPHPSDAAPAAAPAGGLPAAGAAEVLELVGAFARSPLCRRLAAAASVSREASFALTVGPLLVGGYIDVLAEEADGGLLVVDYKTDQVAPDEDLAARVGADYELQRRIYGLAALRTGAPRVEVAYCFLRRSEEVVAVVYRPADAAGLEAGLAGVAAPLLAGRFDVSPRPHRGLCATCPGRARLCSWGEEMTLAEQGAVHEE